MRCPDVFSQRGRGYGHALSPLLLLHLTFTEKAAEAGRTGRLNKRASQGELLSEARIFPDCGWLSGQG